MPASDQYHLNDDDLIAAGFKPFSPNSWMADRWDQGFQFRVRDDDGTRYFVNVFKWDHRPHGHPVGWDVEVSYNDGCSWWDNVMWLRTTCTHKTPLEILDWANQLWVRLSPTYYEHSS